MTDLAPPALLPTLRGLRDRVHADVDRVTGLRAVVGRRPEIDDLLTDIDRQLERLDDVAVITLVGATGAGKSTLLNALAGRTIAEEGVDRPTTRRPTIYAPAEADVGRLLAAAAAAAPEIGVDRVAQIVRHQSPGPWAAHVLVDAPDINGLDRSHRAVVNALAQRSDVLLVVLHHQSVVEAAAVSFLDAFAERRRMVFILNRSDELTPEARAALLEQVRTLATARFAVPEAQVVALSARDARNTPGTTEWVAFRAVLDRLTREPAVRTARRLNALGGAARLARVFDAARDDVAPDLAALPDEVADGLGAIARRAGDEVSVRAELQRSDLTALLCLEVARRWDGPVGWALRTGGPTALGLGTAGLLLRRHPLAAAGAAAGALAAGRADTVRRNERLADARPLTPAPLDLETWYIEALAPARLRSARLTGTPNAFALPPLATVRNRIAAAVEHAWTQVVDVNLPTLAAHPAWRLARWPLDAPVYAFLAWMLYRVGAGFVAGTYAGVDFLLNAALLLAAYLLAVRAGTRAALGRRAASLARHVAGRARSALDADAAQARSATRERVGEARAALDRLCSLPELWRAELGSG